LITLSEAKALALASAAGATAHPVALRDELTLEREFGWVFFYDSVQYLECGDKSAKLYGNSPIIINRRTGAVSRIDTSCAIEEGVEAYETLGQERYDAGEWRELVRNKYPGDGEGL
jgi:hypothetical protein